MVLRIFVLLLWWIAVSGAQENEGKSVEIGPPAVLRAADLKEFSQLSAERREMIEIALAEAKPERWLKYQMGGEDPADGGFDCSGAMYYVLRKAKLQPPRTAADQYEWLKKNQRLRANADGAVKAPDDPFFRALTPGDLLFWGHPENGGRKSAITHVAMYLGREKKDGRPVMINATDGRSYRGKKANGYGVYDFHLPHDDSKTAFMGYGTPPGLAEANQNDASWPEWWSELKTTKLKSDAALVLLIEERFTIAKQIGNEPLVLELRDKPSGDPRRVMVEKSPDHELTGRFMLTEITGARAKKRK